MGVFDNLMRNVEEGMGADPDSREKHELLLLAERAERDGDTKKAEQLRRDARKY